MFWLQPVDAIRKPQHASKTTDCLIWKSLPCLWKIARPQTCVVRHSKVDSCSCEAARWAAKRSLFLAIQDQPPELTSLLKVTYRPYQPRNSENRFRTDNRINRKSPPILQLHPILSRLPVASQPVGRRTCRRIHKHFHLNGIEPL